VLAQLNGEGEVDEVIRRQVEDRRAGRGRRAVPDEVQRHVRQALEYTMEHQRLGEYERCRRRHETDEWMGNLGWGEDVDDEHTFFNRIVRHIHERENVDPVVEAARMAARKVANERAEALLRAALSPKQLKELDRRGYFHVTVQERRFRITRGRAGNILEVDARSRALRKLCAHPVDQVPDADTMLAQKLWLEAMPTEFLKIANVTRIRRKGRLNRIHGEVGRTDGIGEAIVNPRAVERLMVQQVLDHLAQQALDATSVTQEVARENARVITQEITRETPRPFVQVGVETPTPANNERAA
jgi:hypothetical protein